MHEDDLAFRLKAVPSAVFVDLLRESGESLDAKGLKARLVASGVDSQTADGSWRRAQPGVKRHRNVAFDAARGLYRWSSTPVPLPGPVLTAAQALERLLAGRIPANTKGELADLVRAALVERDQLETRLRESYASSAQVRAAQDRQARIDAARALAEVAMEVEELAAAGVEPSVMVARIRALANAFDLRPIGRAGDHIAFDPTHHTPIGGYPPDGAPVVVIRPGYTWRTGDRDLLVGKAQVAPVAVTHG